MSHAIAAATAAAAATAVSRGGEPPSGRRGVTGRAARLLALDQCALEQALGPLELEREDREPDRDHDERGAGEREHRDPASQHHDADDDERAAIEQPAALVLLLTGAQARTIAGALGGGAHPQ